MQTAVVATDQVPSRVSWGAILSGGLVAVAVGASFNILGAAIGSSTIDPLVQGETPDAGSFAIAGAIWLMVSNLLGLACGGYVAARLSGTADSTDGALHGLSVWAIAFLVSAVLLGNAVATTARGVGSVVEGIASSAGAAAGAAGGSAADAVMPQADPRALVQRLQASLQSAGDPAQLTADQRTAEITRLLTRRATDGTLSPEETNRLTAVVAAQFGITQEEASQRIQQLEAQATQLAQQAEQAARQAADTAAKSAAIGSYWVFATLLLGAAAAVIGAQIGIRKTSLLSTRSRRVA